MVEWILDGIESVLEFIVLWFNEKIFSIAGGLFDIFYAFTDLNIIESLPALTTIINRVELLIGLLMLFKLIFSFLTYLISPDKITDGRDGAASVVKNIVIVIILLVVVDFGFSFLYNLEDALLANNTVERLIVGVNDRLDSDQDSSGGGANVTLGQQMTYTVWVSYFTAINMKGSEDNPDYSANESCYSSTSSACDPARNAVAISVLGGNPNGHLMDAAKEENLKTNSLLSIIGGIILCVMLISFTIDIGVRALKLAFLQMISPIPIISYIQPSTQKNLTSWLKMVGSTFADLFIRIAIMLLAMVLISNIPNILDNSSAFESLSGPAWAVAYFLFFLAIYIFAKSIPNLLQDLFGIDMKNSSLNPFSKAGFGALTGGLIGSGVGMLTGGIVGAKAGGIGGALSGALTGGFRGANAGRKSKSLGDIYSNAKTGAKNQAAAAKRRYEEGRLRDRVKKQMMGTFNSGKVAKLNKAHGITKAIASRADAIKQRASKVTDKKLRSRVGGVMFDGRNGFMSARTASEQATHDAALKRFSQYNPNAQKMAREAYEERNELSKGYEEQLNALTKEQREAFENGTYNKDDSIYSAVQNAKTSLDNFDQKARDGGYYDAMNDYKDYSESVEDLQRARDAAGKEYDNEYNGIISEIKEKGTFANADANDQADAEFISQQFKEIDKQNSMLDKDYKIDTDLGDGRTLKDIEKQANNQTEKIERDRDWRPES